MEVFPAPRPARFGGRAGGPSVHEAEFFLPGLEGVLGVFREVHGRTSVGALYHRLRRGIDGAGSREIDFGHPGPASAGPDLLPFADPEDRCR
jgi:hypothetical protein